MAKDIFAKDAEKFVAGLAEALKGVAEFEVPEWAGFVKSGVSRERPPADDDFWHVRAASILRQMYIRGVVGVGRLRTRYGSRLDRGGRASKFRKAGGKIIRVILQQAEAAGLVEKVSRMQHGRRLTAKGRELLDSIEVEEKAGLDFESVVVAPMSTSLGDSALQGDSQQEVVGNSTLSGDSSQSDGDVVDGDGDKVEEVKDEEAVEDGE